MDTATATPTPIDSTDLFALLSQIPIDSKNRAPLRQSFYPSPSRSSTVTPDEDEDSQYEIQYHQALLDEGATPVFEVALVDTVQADPHAYADVLRPWAQYYLSSPPDWQALSAQWERWREFRTWQERVRLRRPKFKEYLEGQRKEPKRFGTEKEAQTVQFEEIMREQWRLEYDYDAVDSEHAKGVTMRHSAAMGGSLRTGLPFRLLSCVRIRRCKTSGRRTSSISHLKLWSWTIRRERHARWKTLWLKPGLCSSSAGLIGYSLRQEKSRRREI